MKYSFGVSRVLVWFAMLAIGCADAREGGSEELGESSAALTTRTLSITVPSGVRPADLVASMVSR